MKKLITILLLTISLPFYSQTIIDLSNMTADITLGSNCSNSQMVNVYETTNDANLNGFTVDLRNSFLKVNGNINGSGNIIKCGQSTLCKTGVIQNNPYIENGLLLNECATLSLQDFNNLNDIPKNTEYKIYDMLGRLLKEGNTNNLQLPKNKIFILKIEGFKPKKIIIN